MFELLKSAWTFLKYWICTFFKYINYAACTSSYCLVMRCCCFPILRAKKFVNNDRIVDIKNFNLTKQKKISRLLFRIPLELMLMILKRVSFLCEFNYELIFINLPFAGHINAVTSVKDFIIISIVFPLISPIFRLKYYSSTKCYCSSYSLTYSLYFLIPLI